ncbi:hypothetical protein AAFC00_003347 [Neodothiora populina]|uniref:Amino acid transporter n=1 Tax=Neodothiora populina TaxID=2781224 RepID=A0ABR3PAD8_9PEZI
MERMGKQQLFRRDFKLFPSFAFVILVQLTWVCLLTSNYEGLLDGGRAGTLWGTVWTFAGFLPVIASLSEMASWAPTSGGQYHWVSEFAPPGWQKCLSFFTGWMSVLSWQAGTASSPLLISGMIQSLVSVNDASYEYTDAKTTAIGVPITFFVLFLNIYCARAMPLMQNLMLILYVLGFVVILVTMLVLSPRIGFGHIFTEFENSGGWSSMGLSMMVGQLTPVFAFLCADSAAHLSEETKDAGLVVPRAMFYSFLVNSVLGIIMLVAFLVCLTDVDAALEDSSGYSFIWVFNQKMSLAGTDVLSSILIILFFGSTVAFNLSTSRQTFAFARDHGLPFSSWLARVEPMRQVPQNALFFTCGVTIVLIMINIGSSTAFNALVSLNVATLMISYVLSMGSLIWTRVTKPDLLPRARWSLGRYGIYINIIAVLYAVFVMFWSFWPESTPTDAPDFNWSSVIFVGVVVLSLLDYFVRGKRNYIAPVSLTKAWKDA